MRPPTPPGSAALAVALAGLTLLLGLSATLSPPQVTVREAPLHEGATVTAEGRLVSARSGDRGFHAVLVDATGRLEVLGRGGGDLRAGDDVRVRGTLGLQGSGYVLSAHRVDVLAPAPGFVRSVDEVLADPDRYADAPVALRGVARDGRLRDAGGGASVTLVEAAGDAGPPEGVGVLVEGDFTYRPKRGAYELHVHAWRRL